MMAAIRMCRVVGALALLVSCGKSGATPAPDAPVKIGVLLAETGAADFIGKDEKLVLQHLADRHFREHSKSRVALVFRNTSSLAQMAVAEFNELIADSGVSVVIGGSTSGESLLLAKAAEQAGVPFLSLAASRKITVGEDGVTRRWAFQFAPNDDLAVRQTLAVMRAEGIKRAGLRHSDDAFGRDGAEIARRVADSIGITLVAGAEARNAPAILIWSTMGTDAILEELRYSRSKQRVFLAHGNTSASFLSSAGAAAEGARLLGSRVLSEAGLDSALQSDAPVIAYRSFWSQIADGAPSTFGGHAYDALDAIFKVVDDSVLEYAGARRRQTIRERLETLGPFLGATGVFKFTPTDHAGLGPEAFQLYEIRGGKLVPVPISGEAIVFRGTGKH